MLHSQLNIEDDPELTEYVEILVYRLAEASQLGSAILLLSD